ncbi:MAG TPA: O-antigen ligase family protein [Candidatus Acidoferrum sp.]|nr:O-antigen ligase family protein [Candidatus Acidoferrum sp.]
MSRLSTNPHQFAQRIDRPSWTMSILFLLLFSGPPRFRYRDPTASLEGKIDPVVVFQVAVWLIAGIWLLVYFMNAKRRRALRWGLLQKISALFVLLIGFSVAASVAPSLTAFKVFQVLVVMLFTFVFVERYGTARYLDELFWCSVIMCGAVALCAFIAPDLVTDISEMGATRLRGELIADTGVVSMLAVLLLLGWMRRLWKPLFLILLLLCFSLLILSLARWAYIAVLAFAVLAVSKRSGSKGARWIGAGILTGFSVFLVSGGMNTLAEFRDPASVSTLSDRLGLWAYLSDITMSSAPWAGLGYYSASRLYGPEYNPGLGTAHSMFVEAFVGAGWPALVVLVLLCVLLGVYAVKALGRNNADYSMIVAALVFGVVLGGAVGAPIESGPLAVAFWGLVTVVSEQSEMKASAAL